MELKNCVYRFIDKKNRILYVGKIKNLKNRIKNNYHTSKHLPDECYDKTSLIEYIKFNNENDMDFAEQYYIQKYKPAYNTAYQNKQITISVPDLDKKTWSIFYIDKNTAEKQLSEFYYNLCGEPFKFTTIKVDIDLYDYLKYRVLKDSEYFKERKLFQAFLKKGEPLNANHTKWYSNLIKKHEENENLHKLDYILNFENKLSNELKKNLDIMFKEYPLLSYVIEDRAQVSNISYNDIKITISELMSIFDIENNRFLMTLHVYYKGSDNFNKNKSTRISCTLYVKCN